MSHEIPKEQVFSEGKTSYMNWETSEESPEEDNVSERFCPFPDPDTIPIHIQDWYNSHGESDYKVLLHKFQEVIDKMTSERNGVQLEMQAHETKVANLEAECKVYQNLQAAGFHRRYDMLDMMDDLTKAMCDLDRQKMITRYTEYRLDYLNKCICFCARRLSVYEHVFSWMEM